MNDKNFILNHKKLTILILGSEFSGKTTFIENLAKQMCLEKIEDQTRSYYKLSRYILKDIKKISFLHPFMNNSFNNKKKKLRKATTDIDSDTTNTTFNNSKNNMKYRKSSKKNIFAKLNNTNNMNDIKNDDDSNNKKFNSFIEGNKNQKKKNLFDMSGSNSNNSTFNLNCKTDNKVETSNRVNSNKETLYSVIIEFREIFSEEIESNFKMCTSFYEDACVSFVIADYEYNESFVEAVRWKEKIDLMCCSKTEYPIPVFLIVNKIDSIINYEINTNAKATQIEFQEDYCSYQDNKRELYDDKNSPINMNNGNNLDNRVSDLSNHTIKTNQLNNYESNCNLYFSEKTNPLEININNMYGIIDDAVFNINNDTNITNSNTISKIQRTRANTNDKNKFSDNIYITNKYTNTTQDINNENILGNGTDISKITSNNTNNSSMITKSNIEEDNVDTKDQANMKKLKSKLTKTQECMSNQNNDNNEIGESKLNEEYKAIDDNENVDNNDKSSYFHNHSIDDGEKKTSIDVVNDHKQVHNNNDNNINSNIIATNSNAENAIQHNIVNKLSLKKSDNYLIYSRDSDQTFPNEDKQNLIEISNDEKAVVFTTKTNIKCPFSASNNNECNNNSPLLINPDNIRKEVEKDVEFQKTLKSFLECYQFNNVFIFSHKISCHQVYDLNEIFDSYQGKEIIQYKNIRLFEENLNNTFNNNSKNSNSNDNSINANVEENSKDSCDTRKFYFSINQYYEALMETLLFYSNFESDFKLYIFKITEAELISIINTNYKQLKKKKNRKSNLNSMSVELRCSNSCCTVF